MVSVSNGQETEGGQFAAAIHVHQPFLSNFHYYVLRSSGLRYGMAIAARPRMILLPVRNND